jgi:hypothetical protein
LRVTQGAVEVFGVVGAALTTAVVLGAVEYDKLSPA